MTGTIEWLYMETTERPIYSVVSVNSDGVLKTILYIAVHKGHWETFKTERGARNWLARWEKKE